MKISINDKEIFTLSEVQMKVIKNDIPEDFVEEDIKRRIYWVLYDQKYQKCFERLKMEWEPKLKKRMSSIPTNDEELAELIFKQPDYKSRKTRDSENAKL